MLDIFHSSCEIFAIVFFYFAIIIPHELFNLFSGVTSSM